MASSNDAITANLAYFFSIPWVATHISTPGWIPCPMGSRKVKSSNEDSFFSTTLQTPATLARHLSLCKADSLPVPASTVPLRSNTSLPPISETKTFYEIGTGLDGYPRVAHGGLIATLLDEQMGVLLSVNAKFGTQAGEKSEINAMTLFLNVRYKAPLKTPGIIMATAVCTKREGRKTFVRAAVVDENGVECAIGEGMFIEVPQMRL